MTSLVREKVAEQVPRLLHQIARSCLPLVAIAFAIAMAATSTAAQDERADRQPIQVGLYLSPPFVIEANGKYSGMAVELWNSLATATGLRSEFRLFPTVGALLGAATAGEIDVAVSNITITKKRAERMDFTYPWFDAGMRIMVNKQQRNRLSDLAAGLRNSGFLKAYGWVAAIIVIATFLLTLFDRRFDESFPRRWRDGLAESFFSVVSLFSGKSTGRKNLFGWWGRIWQAVWLVFGIGVVAFVTSSVTSVMTTLSLQNQISSLADLPGKPIGVIEGSVSDEFALKSGFVRHPYATIDDAVADLLNGTVDAIVGDAPVLEYYAYTRPESGVEVIGAIFEPDKYGFALPRDSSLTRPLTVELVGSHERGFIEELHDKYFGNAP